MKYYSEERKQSALKKMMPPQNLPVSQLVKETGISDCTLYTWRKEARLKGVVVPGNGKNARIGPLKTSLQWWWALTFIL